MPPPPHPQPPPLCNLMNSQERAIYAANIGWWDRPKERWQIHQFFEGVRKRVEQEKQREEQEKQRAQRWAEWEKQEQEKQEVLKQAVLKEIQSFGFGNRDTNKLMMMTNGLEFKTVDTQFLRPLKVFLNQCGLSRAQSLQYLEKIRCYSTDNQDFLIGLIIEEHFNVDQAFVFLNERCKFHFFQEAAFSVVLKGQGFGSIDILLQEVKLANTEEACDLLRWGYLFGWRNEHTNAWKKSNPHVTLPLYWLSSLFEKCRYYLQDNTPEQIIQHGSILLATAKNTDVAIMRISVFSTAVRENHVISIKDFSEEIFALEKTCYNLHVFALFYAIGLRKTHLDALAVLNHLISIPLADHENCDLYHFVRSSQDNLTPDKIATWEKEVIAHEASIFKPSKRGYYLTLGHPKITATIIGIQSNVCHFNKYHINYSFNDQELVYALLPQQRGALTLLAQLIRAGNFLKNQSKNNELILPYDVWLASLSFVFGFQESKTEQLGKLFLTGIQPPAKKEDSCCCAVC